VFVFVGQTLTMGAAMGWFLKETSVGKGLNTELGVSVVACHRRSDGAGGGREVCVSLCTTPIGQTCTCEPMTWLYFVSVQSVFVFVVSTLAAGAGYVALTVEEKRSAHDLISNLTWQSAEWHMVGTPYKFANPVVTHNLKAPGFGFNPRTSIM
jgi:hypothetical protein